MRKILLPFVVELFFRDNKDVSISVEEPYEVRQLASFHVDGTIDEALIWLESIILLTIEDKNIDVDLEDQKSRKCHISQSYSQLLGATEYLINAFDFTPLLMYSILQNGRQWILIRQENNEQLSFKRQIFNPIVTAFDQTEINLQSVSTITKWLIICFENVKSIVDIISKNTVIPLAPLPRNEIESNHSDTNNDNESNFGTNNKKPPKYNSNQSNHSFQKTSSKGNSTKAGSKRGVLTERSLNNLNTYLLNSNNR
eukprot:gene21568-27926_t